MVVLFSGLAFETGPEFLLAASVKVHTPVAFAIESLLNLVVC